MGISLSDRKSEIMIQHLSTGSLLCPLRHLTTAKQDEHAFGAQGNYFTQTK